MFDKIRRGSYCVPVAYLGIFSEGAWNMASASLSGGRLGAKLPVGSRDNAPDGAQGASPTWSWRYFCNEKGKTGSIPRHLTDYLHCAIK